MNRVGLSERRSQRHLAEALPRGGHLAGGARSASLKLHRFDVRLLALSPIPGELGGADSWAAWPHAGATAGETVPRFGRSTSKWIVPESRDPEQTRSLRRCNCFVV